MFVLQVPNYHKVGDTMDCNINGESKQVTWRDENTLVIGTDDARAILTQTPDGDLIRFVCGDAGESTGDYGADVLPGGGFILSHKTGEQ